jgi:AcrR family transcriptional regulator
VLAELAERGYEALTMEGVAARAGTGKASLYRRWSGKRNLVLAAVQAGVPDPEDLPDAGSLRADLLAYLSQVAAHLRGPAGPALRAILADVPGDPAGAAASYRATHRRRSAERLRILAGRAVTRGELTPDRFEAVTPRQWEAGPAVVRHHFLWEGEVGDALCAEVVDEIVLPLLIGRTVP